MLHCRGSILVVTMWIVLVLAGLVLVLAQTMRVEAGASANLYGSLQAEAVEQGAIQYVLARVDNLQGKVPVDADMPCEAISVGPGGFWIIRPNFDDDHVYSYGLVDEGSKVNLNSASAEMLSKLPDMTDELGPCLIDWRDADSTITTGGAESEYYALLDNPYQCKNAPLETVEELLMVKGATPAILFGEDANRNGVLDENEDDADASDPPDNRDGHLDRGMFPFITVYSAEPNKAVDGSARTNIATAGPAAVASLLGNSVSADRALQIQTRLRRARVNGFQNALDFYIRAGLTATEFAAVADQVTTATATVLKGLINVSTAPKEVLATLPGLDDADVASLVAKRIQAGVDLTNIAWVADALPPAKAVAIGGFITARSYQFSADIVSVAPVGRAFRRCRIVVDAQTSPPKVIYRQDLTHLGWPLAADTLARLKAGVPFDRLTTVQTLGQEVAP